MRRASKNWGVVAVVASTRQPYPTSIWPGSSTSIRGRLSLSVTTPVTRIVLPLKCRAGSPTCIPLNLAAPVSVTATARFLGSWWSSSESRKICEQCGQFFAALTSISTVTCSLTRPAASWGESGMAAPSPGDSVLGQEDRQQERGVLNPLDRVRLPRGQVEQLPG